MKIIIQLITIVLLLMISTAGFGRSMITGKVVDAKTGELIEEAAVYIYWSKMGKGPPGLAGYVKVEVAEDLTSKSGEFKIPKYSTWFNEFRMAVYKKGYVCWSSRKIFPSYNKRKGFKLKKGVVIALELFRDEYSKEKHADFTLDSSIGRKSGLFDNAIQIEKDLIKRIAHERKKNKWRSADDS